MQTLYMRSRRILAGILAVALSVCAVMTLARDPHVVDVIVGIIVAVLLVAVVILPGTRLRLDISTFLSAWVCLGACRGTLGRKLSAAGSMVIPAIVAVALPLVIGLYILILHPFRETLTSGRIRLANHPCAEFFRALEISRFDVVVLDEPFNGVDEESSRVMVSDINEWRKDSLVLLVAHALPDGLTVDETLGLPRTTDNSRPMSTR